MKTLLMSYRKNKYRYITINVDKYWNQILQGRIWNEALKEEVEFCGWIDFMTIVNQIYDKTNIPKRTLELRSFKPTKERILQWSDSEREQDPPAPDGVLMSFRLFLTYRHHASWQGNLYCQKQKRYYKFASFLELLRLMDCLMKGLDPEKLILEAVRCSCQMVVNDYNSGDMLGDVQNASTHWMRQFSNTIDLIEGLLGLHSDIARLKKNAGDESTDREGLTLYIREGSKAAFSVKILYHRNTEWQGYIYCLHLKQEKAFRSFMEMLYLIASVLEKPEVKNADMISFETAI